MISSPSGSRSGPLSGAKRWTAESSGVVVGCAVVVDCVVVVVGVDVVVGVVVFVE